MLEIFKRTTLAMLVICLSVMTMIPSKKDQTLTLASEPAEEQLNNTAAIELHVSAKELHVNSVRELHRTVAKERSATTQEQPQQTLVAKTMKTTAMEQIVVEETEQDYLYNLEDMELMARTVYAEARGESFDGKVAVAHVIINRLESGRFGDSVRKVVFAKNQFAVSRRYDDESMQAVEAAVKEKLYPEDMFYFRVSKKKSWRNFVFYDRIGNHSFYCAG